MLYELLGDTRTVSVIGMCKNAGKTTALNAFIKACADHNEVLGLTSIGRDGERSDIVTNTGKPEIFVESDTVVATAERLLSEGDISKEILDVTPISTPLGSIVIVRAMASGFVQIGGPSMTNELICVRDELFGFGCSRVFVDGAISRKSLGTPLLADGVVLCSGASYDPDIRKTVYDTAYIASLFTLPEYSPKAPMNFETKFTAVNDNEFFPAESVIELQPYLRSNGAEILFINGALTDKIAAELNALAKLLAKTYLVVLDASRLLLGKPAFDKLIRFSAGMRVLKSTKLLAVTVNPFSAYGNHYDKNTYAECMASALHASGLDVPVIDVTDI